MAQEFLGFGLGYVEAGRRYGYTDGTLWYLGESRLFIDSLNANRFTALTYSELKQRVDLWVSASTATRTTYPTNDETRVGPGFKGVLGDGSRNYYYQNYIYIGKPDPAPYPKSNSLVEVFNYPPLALSGVGFGYADGRFNGRDGYSDSKFWWKGECRLFKVAQLPASIREIPLPVNGPPAASGIRYYSSTDGYTYVASSAGDPYILLDFPYLQSLVNNWEGTHQKTGIGYDWLSSGFLWLGQSYWQAQGYQAIPDEFAVALNDCERNLQTVMAWLPGTKRITTQPNTGGFTVTLPAAQNRTSPGSNLGDLAALSYLLGRGKSKKKRKKRGK